MGYIGKIEKNSSLFLISIFGAGELQQIANYTKDTNVMRYFVP